MNFKNLKNLKFFEYFSKVLARSTRYALILRKIKEKKIKFVSIIWLKKKRYLNSEIFTFEWQNMVHKTSKLNNRPSLFPFC